MSDPNRPVNRLAREASPYLRQHMHDPVDWHPWGEEAFARARQEDKPLLLSVGYAACHWCHVMAHDAFSVPEVAAEMNRHFVSVKVDREERPDVDQLYQGVLQLQRRGGGWPLTVFLTPEGRPFFGGTYFPPQDRHGLPAFPKVLAAIARAFRQDRAAVEESAASFERGLLHLARLGLDPGTPDEPTMHDLASAARDLVAELDPVHGGFFGAPKFPHPMELAFLLRLGARPSPDVDGPLRTSALHAVSSSLQAMARGGLRDVLGGGFHRYCVDAGWEVPHFEKMLYDNALLVRLYAEAAVALPAPELAAVARELAGWLSRELTDPGGGLFSSQDADSEGEEGRFFVFRRDELDRILGPELGALAAAHLGVTPEGNFEHGATVLSLARTAAELPAERGEPVEAVEAQLAEVRARLFDARERRIRPATDDKVITAWNGLAIGGLAAAGRLLGDPALITQARRAADFVLGTLLRDGRLLRVYRGGVVQQSGFLDDHAALCEGLVELFESTGERSYLDAARQLADTIVARFWDDATASFRLSPDDGERLIAPQSSVHDNAVPAGASSAVTAFLRLHALCGDERLFTLAHTYLSARRASMLQNPFAFGHLLAAAFLAVRGLTEVAVLGPPGPARDALLAAARAGFAPERIAFAAASAPSPWLADRPTPDRPIAYLCRASACEAPVEDASRLRERLAEAP